MMRLMLEGIKKGERKNLNAIIIFFVSSGQVKEK
jgi:hypothetical protein